MLKRGCPWAKTSSASSRFLFLCVRHIFIIFCCLLLWDCLEVTFICSWDVNIQEVTSVKLWPSYDLSLLCSFPFLFQQVTSRHQLFHYFLPLFSHPPLWPNFSWLKVILFIYFLSVFRRFSNVQCTSHCQSHSFCKNVYATQLRDEFQVCWYAIPISANEVICVKFCVHVLIWSRCVHTGV